MTSGPTTVGFSPTDLKSERAHLLRDAIIDALSPPSVEDRESSIPESFSNTYRWIFTHPQFEPWLSGQPLSEKQGLTEKDMEGRDRIFWINGHPGSGKSTLMRYIHQSPLLSRALRRWSSNSAVTIASFFIWENGTTMQRTLSGLLRSLLHRLLSSSPHLLPYTMPDLWSSLWTASTMERVQKLSSWEEDTLLFGMRRFFEMKDRPPAFLIIDGMDELEGDQQSLVMLLKDIASCDRVKLCLSSRPWSTFTEALGEVPTLRLQEMTSDDMRQYIRGNLRTAQWNLGDNERHAIEDDLVRRAGGVFLWIHFAVSDLLENAQGVDQLKIRLTRLPDSLDGFFEFKLFTQPDLAPEMSRIFQLMRARREVGLFTGDNDGSSMTLWDMAVTMEPRDQTTMRAYSIRKVSGAEIGQRCASTVDLLAEATRKLVRIQGDSDDPQPENILTYIHRTVNEWLSQPDTWDRVVALEPDLHPHLAHLASVVEILRCPIETPRRNRRIMAWWSQIVLGMTHARYARAYSDVVEEMYDLLDLLNETLEWYYFPCKSDDPRIDHWARSCIGTMESRGATPYEDPWLSLVVRFGVTGYVRRYLEDDRYDFQGGESVLKSAVYYLINRQKSLYPLSDPEVVSLLLEAGMDPNYRWVHPEGNKKLKTPWEFTLESVQQGLRRGWLQSLDDSDTTRWAKIVTAFMGHGAETNIQVKATYRDKEESAVALFDRAKDIRPCNDINEICNDLHKHQI